MQASLIKYQVENCPALPGRNLISTCNRSVKFVSAGRVDISSRQAGIMQSPPYFTNLEILSNLTLNNYPIVLKLRIELTKRDITTD